MKQLIYLQKACLIYPSIGPTKLSSLSIKKIEEQKELERYFYLSSGNVSVFCTIWK